MDFGASLKAREDYIARADKNKSSYKVPFQDGHIVLEGIRVPIKILKYRLGNMRSERDQFDYINKHGKEEDFFTKDKESIEAQEAQHQVLKKLLGSGKANLVTFFKRRRKTRKRHHPHLRTRVPLPFSSPFPPAPRPPA